MGASLSMPKDRRKSEPSSSTLAQRSPAQTIPYDIHANILMHTLPNQMESVLEEKSSVRSRRYSPITSTQVCRSWRSAALDTPRLWATIPITIPTYTPGQPDAWCREIKATIHALHTFIKLSKNSPLSLFLGYYSTTFSTCASGPPPVLPRKAARWQARLIQELVKTAPRWKHVEMYLWVDGYMADLLKVLDQVPTTLPILESTAFKIYATDSWADATHGDHDELRMSTGGLFTSPKLRSVSLLGGWGSLDFAQMGGSWSTSITELDVAWTPMGPRQAMQVLQAFPRLVKCSIALSMRGYFAFEGGEGVTLKHLTSLRFAGCPIPGTFSEALALPSLAVLDLTVRSVPDGFSDSTRANTTGPVCFIKRFGNQLSALSVTSVSELVETGCFDHLENLVAFGAWFSPVDVEALVSLFEHPTETYIPKLRELVMRFRATRSPSTDEDFKQEAAIASVLKARRQAEEGGIGRVKTLRVGLAS